VHADVLTRAVRDHRRSLVAWAVGIGLYVMLIVAVWPSIRDSGQLKTAFEDYPDALKEFFGGEASFDFATAAGFLNAELFSLMLPLLLSVLAIGFGASILAGEEERGLLDLVLSYPVPRARLVWEKGASLVVGLGVMAAMTAATLLGVGAIVDVDVRASNLVAAITGSVLVAGAMGFVALAVGAWRGSRAAAIGVAAAVFGASYLLQVLAGFVDALQPTRWVSATYLANGSMPVRNGWPVVEFCVLAMISAVLLVVARWGFDRRDLAG